MREIVREAVLTHMAADPSAIPTALAQYVAALAPWLSDASVTELCINRPGEVFVERASGWTREAAIFATLLWCQAFAKLVAGATKQRVSAETPLLSASLPIGRTSAGGAATGSAGGNSGDHDPPAEWPGVGAR